MMGANRVGQFAATGAKHPQPFGNAPLHQATTGPLFAGNLFIEPVCRPFGQPPVVDKDERGLVLANLVEDARHNRRPDGVAR